MKRLMPGVLVLCAFAVSHAQVPRDSLYEATVQRGIQEVYNLEFEKAERDFTMLVSLRPQHPAGHFFRAMITWWRIVIDMDNTQYDAQFFAELDVVVHLCDSLLEVNPSDVDAIFSRAAR